MIDHKQELYEDLDQLRDYALTVKKAAQDMLDWLHVIETDMQLFIEDQTKPAFVKLDVQAEPKPEPYELNPSDPIVDFEPGSACIDPDGVGCRCYEGCTADCLPSEYKSCKCPRKIQKDVPCDEPEDVQYELTDKGRLIVNLINNGFKYLDACQVAEKIYPKE